MTSEMISVTKQPDASWDDLKPQILAELMDYVSLGEEAVIEKTENPSADDVIQRITGLLNARIRPAVQQDGGDIAFIKFEDGIVYVEMRGNCAGCPYAMVTLKEGVEKILKSYIPEVREVKNFKKN